MWKRFGLVQGPPEALPHLFSPPPLKGDPAPPRHCGAFGRAASSRFLIVGPLATPNRNRPPAARHCVYRPSAGALRRLRPRSAFPGGERYAHPASRWLVRLLWSIQQPVDAAFRNVEIRILLIHFLDRESFKKHRVNQLSVGDIVSQDRVTYPLSIFFNSML